MQINEGTAKPDYYLNINEVEYVEDLYIKATTFDFENLNLDLLKKEVMQNDRLLNRLTEFVCGMLGFSYEELINHLNFSKIESNKPNILKLVEEKEKIIKVLFIDFMFELLPFNYLIKISKKRGKYDLLVDIREDIIGILLEEIEKVNNFNDTAEIVYKSLGAKIQKEQYVNISNKIASKSKHVIIENKFLIGLIDDIPVSNLETIVNDLCSSKFVWDNLY